jgi:excisionase family DNA binding protein
MIATIAALSSCDGAIASLDDLALVKLTIAGDESARLALIERHSAALREAARDSNPALSTAEACAFVDDLWSSIVAGDMAQLRAFDPSRGAALLSWLTVRLSQVMSRRDAADDSPRTLMRVEEVARRWGIDRKTVYAMIERGQLAARRCGRLVRIPRKTVESFELQASVSPERTS